MFKLLTTTAIVAALLAAWLAPAARSQATRPAGCVELTPSQAFIEVHRQLHRHLLRVAGKKSPPATSGRVDWASGRATTSCPSLKTSPGA